MTSAHQMASRPPATNQAAVGIAAMLTGRSGSSPSWDGDRLQVVFYPTHQDLARALSVA
jgi:hypothetical protein